MVPHDSKSDLPLLKFAEVNTDPGSYFVKDIDNLSRDRIFYELNSFKNMVVHF